ncbi:MAG: hypothetical protein WD939_06160, partial [Dehalococcoidia bacterium]
MANSIRSKFIDKFRPYKQIEPVPKLASVYTTFNEVWLYVRFSSLGKNGRYWFDVDTYKVNEWKDTRRFVVCFICGDEDTVVFLPDEQLLAWYADVEPNRKGHLMVTIAVDRDRLILKLPGSRPDYDVTDYINRFDYVSKSIPVRMLRQRTGEPKDRAPTDDAAGLIMSHPDLDGATLHERVIDMLAQIGQWTGYVPRKSFKEPEDSPYEIDVVWLRNDILDVAIEVQVGGNETEAKDRLVHAKRFGARKIIVVSKPESIARLRSLCRYEPDLKNWLQVWSISKAYQMYIEGKHFFPLFRPYERPQCSEEISEFDKRE